MKNLLKKSLSVILAITIIFSSAYVGLNEVDFSGVKFNEINFKGFDFSGVSEFIKGLIPDFSVKSQAANSGTCGDNLTWTLDDEGTLTISGTGEMDNFLYISWACSEAPWYSVRSSIKEIIINNGVTSVGACAFYCCTNLVSITLPDSLTRIDGEAFYCCTSLAFIEIPDGVESIGGCAFEGCITLTSINIPNTVTSIGDSAFRDCDKLVQFTIPDSVKSIYDLTFCSCDNLKTITIPDSITSIGYNVFSGCTSLTAITIPDSVTSIGEDAFSDCKSLVSVYITDITSWCNIDFENVYSNPLLYADNLYINGELATNIFIPDGVSVIPQYAFSCTNLISITISDSVTSIDESAFSDCTSLTAIEIPNSVTNIGEWAFQGCTNLISMKLPDGITSISAYTFCNCTNLNSITIPDSVTSIVDFAFYNCISLTSLEIPDGVTSIGEYAFSGCISLTAITIPNSITSICDGAFSGCINLENITIPDSVTSIGDSAFRNCEKLVSIDISSSVTSIGDGVFSYCTNLATIIIPNGVMNIGDSAFRNCEKLVSIEIPGSVTSMGDYIFENCLSLASITIPDSVTSIGEYAFSGCISLTANTIPNSITSICDGAFSGCINLENITIPDSVTSIGGSTFYDCDSLKSVTIGNSVTSIGFDAFYDCDNLISITIPDNVTSIGGSAFYDCDSLESVAIGNGVTYIGNGSFSRCEKLTSVYLTDISSWCNIDFENLYSNPLYYAETLYVNGQLATDVVIPDGVTSICDSAFYNCISLTSIVIPDSVTSIGEKSFYGCTNLTSVFITDVAAWCNIDFGYGSYQPLYYADNLYINGELATDVAIPYGVTAIPDYAFSCTSLTSITIPNSVTSIGYRCFWGCTNLTSVIIPDSITTVGNATFKDCINLTSVKISDSVSSIDISAFSGCTSLTEINVDENNATYSSVDGILLNKDKTILIKCPQGKTECTISDTVTSIGNHAFYDCNSLVSVKMGNNVTSIGYETFFDCDSLTSITIPDSVTNIDERAFYSCKSLNSVELGSGIVSIDDSAFYNCAKLISIVIPDSVTSIGNYAFSRCTSLKSVTIGNGVASIGTRAFYSCWNLISVYIADVGVWCGIDFDNNESNPLYYSEELYVNGKLTTEIVIPNDVITIGDYTFCGYDSLTAIIIPDSVTSIGTSAFNGCKSFTSIEIPNSVTSIGNGAFCNCYSLKYIFYEGTEEDKNNIIIGDDNTSLLEDAFWHYESTDHNIVDVPEVEPTCAESGKTAGRKCTVCGYEVVVQETIPATGHIESAWIIDTEATCVEVGVKHKECTVCHKTLKTADIPETGHNFAETVISESSCTEYAEIEKRCEVCGLTETHTLYEEIGHCYEKITSGKNAGRYKCTQCNIVVDDVFASRPDEICSLNPQDLVVDAISYYVYGFGTPSTTNVDFVMHYLEHSLSRPVQSVPAEAFEAKAIAYFDVSPDELRETQNRFVRYNPDNNTYESMHFYGYGGAGHYSGLGYVKNGDQYHVYWNLHGELNPNNIYDTFRCTIEYTNNTPKIIEFVSVEFEDVPDNLITGHKSSSWITDKEATVYKAGSKHKECAECGEVLKTETIPQLKCSKPVLKKVYNANSYVKVTWGTVKGADIYRVYRKTGTGSYEYIGSTTNTYFNDKEAGAGKTCRYRIRAKNEAGYSEYSASLAIKHVDEPTLKSIENSAYGVLIKWGKVTGAEKYNVYRKVSGGEYKYIGATSDTYYTDKTVKSGTKYYYAIRAKRDDSISSQSASLSKYYLADPTLKTPTSTTSGIKLSWSKVTGAEGYIIYRKTGSGSYTKLKTEKGISNLSYTDSSAKKGKKYYYKVKAYKSKTYSAYSNTKAITDKY